MRGPHTWLDGLNDWLLRTGARTVAGRAADPQRRMTRGEGYALFVYLVALLASRVVLPHAGAPWMRLLLALLPLPPIVLLVALAVRRVSGMDELQRRIELVVLAVTAAAAWLGFSVAWLLAEAGVALPSPLLGFWGMPLLYVFARRWAGRRYA